MTPKRTRTPTPIRLAGSSSAPLTAVDAAIAACISPGMLHALELSTVHDQLYTAPSSGADGVEASGSYDTAAASSTIV